MNCPNCERFLGYDFDRVEGFGAGSGRVSTTCHLCPVCRNGCMRTERDEIPGFRSTDHYPCCNCKAEWERSAVQ